MVEVSFQCIDGVDKGRIYRNLPTPVTLGREEGNSVRLNDERVSRFHAKIQEDHGQVVLTDLDSTNGTKVNGESVQLRLIRPGDRISVGRSVLVYGTWEDIRKSIDREKKNGDAPVKQGHEQPEQEKTVLPDDEADFMLDSDHGMDVFRRLPPKLPARLTPAQAAQLSEVIDFLHRALAEACRPVHIPPKANEATIPLEHWQRIQAVLTFLAQYSRAVAEPEDLTEVGE